MQTRETCLFEAKYFSSQNGDLGRKPEPVKLDIDI